MSLNAQNGSGTNNQDGTTTVKDLSLEDISSEELLLLKDELQAKKDGFETDRVNLLQKGLAQSKRYLEDTKKSFSTTALILLQRAEYLYDQMNDEYQSDLDSVSKLNEVIMKSYEANVREVKARLKAENKQESAIEEEVAKIPLDLLPDPQKEYGNIILTYQELLDKFPDSRYVADAMYNVAFLKEMMGKQLKAQAFEMPDQEARLTRDGDRLQQQALRLYQDLVIRFSDSKYAPEAYNRTGEYYFGSGGEANLNKAIKFYNKVLDYPESRRFQPAVYKLAWTYYRLEDYPKAISYFNFLIEDVDTSKAYNSPNDFTLDPEAIEYIGICFNRWGELIDEQRGTKSGAHKLLTAYLKDAGLSNQRYAADLAWSLAESYNKEQKDTLAIYAYAEVLKHYPNYEKAPNAQFRITEAFDRMSNAESKNVVIAKAFRDSVLSNRYKLYANYRPGSEWSKNQNDQSKVRAANKLARDALLENINYYYAEAQTTNDLQNWKIAMDISKNFITYFPTDTFAYFVHYNLAQIQYQYFQELDSAYHEFVKVSVRYKYDQYRYRSAIAAISIADSLAKRDPFIKPEKINPDSTVPLTEGEERLIDALNSYSRLFPDTITKYPMDSDTSIGVPGKRGAEFLSFAGQIYYQHGDFNTANQYFNTVVRRYPTSAEAVSSQRYLMTAYYARNDFRSAEIVAKRLLESSKIAPKQKEDAIKTVFLSIFRHAEFFKENKEHSKAAREFRRAYDEGVKIGYPDAKNLVIALYNSADEYDQGKEYRRSISSYELFAQTYPEDKLAANALYNAAYYYDKLREYKSAATTSELVSDKYPQMDINNGQVTAEKVLYNATYFYEKAAEVAEKKNESVESKYLFNEAIRSSNKFVEKYPASKLATDVDFGIAKLYFALGEDEKAFQKYDDFAQRFPDDKRNVQALYEVGMNHLKNNRETQAIDALRRTRERSDDLQAKGKDHNPFYAGEAVFELSKIKYKEFASIKLTLPNTDDKEQRKFDLVLELVDLYDAIVGYASIRAYEAIYKKATVNEEFADALMRKEFQKEANLFKQIAKQAEVYIGASKAYRGAVDQYKATHEFLKKAQVKLNKDEKVLADSLRLLYPTSEDSFQTALKVAVEGSTAKEKEFSIRSQQEIVSKYKDVSISRVSRLLYQMAETKKRIVDAFVAAPTESEYGTLEYVQERALTIAQVVQPRVLDAVKSFEEVSAEADSMGIVDKYTAEAKRNIATMLAIGPRETANLAYIVLDLYEERSSYYRKVTRGGEDWIDPDTKKGFYDVFYEVPAFLNVYISQFASQIGASAVRAYTNAVTQINEKGIVNESSRQIEKEYFDFAYQFARRNYTIADTAEYYYKTFESKYYTDQDNLFYYADASDAYNQIIAFARDNGKVALEEIFNGALDLSMLTLNPDPDGGPDDEVVETDSRDVKKIMALLAKYDPYYARLLKLKPKAFTFASNYDDWLTNNTVPLEWKKLDFDDSDWFNAAPPSTLNIASLPYLDSVQAYPLWLGLGQKFDIPELPKFIPASERKPKVEVIAVDTAAVDSVGTDPFDVDSTQIDPGPELDADSVEIDTLGEGDEDVESYLWASQRGLLAIQDTTKKRFLTQAQIQQQLDTASVIYIRKKFIVNGNPQGATIRIAADGYYEFFINGAFVSAMSLEKQDDAADTTEIHEVFPESLKQGENVLALVLQDSKTKDKHHGIRIFMSIREVEDLTAAYREPPLPPGTVLNDKLIRKGRVFIK